MSDFPNTHIAQTFHLHIERSRKTKSFSLAVGNNLMYVVLGINQNELFMRKKTPPTSSKTYGM